MTGMNIKEIKKYFPQVQNHPDAVYLDSASTTLKLKTAIDRIQQFYTHEVSNVHRGSYPSSSRITDLYEESRQTTAEFLSAERAEEIVFTKSTTEGINLLAYALQPQLKEGDEILLTQMEHHSNFLPWQILAQKHRLKIKLLPVTPQGELDLSKLDRLLTSKVRLFSFVHQSNALGSVNPIQTLIQKAKQKGILTLVDAAQSCSTQKINVQHLDCDFLVFSAHKLFSAFGVGVVYGKKSLWEKLSPYQTGGGMVLDSVKKIWAKPPHCFEAGTPSIAGVLALSSVIKFLKQHTSFEEIAKYEKYLLDSAEDVLRKIPGLKIIGASPTRINISSFVIDGLHSDDLALLMGRYKTAVRSGHHCCQPLMDQYRLKSGTVRVSFSVYNKEEDILALKNALLKAIDILRGV